MWKSLGASVFILNYALWFGPMAPTLLQNSFVKGSAWSLNGRKCWKKTDLFLSEEEIRCIRNDTDRVCCRMNPSICLIEARGGNSWVVIFKGALLVAES
jgi:hypothetical protein